MSSKENVKKILQALGIALSIIGSIGNQNGLIIVGGGMTLIGTILLLR